MTDNCAITLYLNTINVAQQNNLFYLWQVIKITIKLVISSQVLKSMYLTCDLLHLKPSNCHKFLTWPFFFYNLIIVTYILYKSKDYIYYNF